ncbi:MAG: hypothetical protein KatS3mg001_570 [Candidatus Pacearchaeota archaeon]|nr:MAG: hypothetical protein KatS3mg001_570 [Candidatus Pacearchaeota archaeon]
MKEKKILVKLRGKKYSLKGKELSGFEQFFGLMFKKKEKAEILIFKMKKPKKIKIHSFFVFFPFIAIFLNSRKEVVDIKVIKPFKFFFSSKKAKFLIEIPIK